MEPFDVVITSGIGIAKDPNPLGAQPIKPKRDDFKDDEKFMKAESLFLGAEKKWNAAELTLKQYVVSSILTDAKEVISAKVLHFHVGKKYKAILLEGVLIQII